MPTIIDASNEPWRQWRRVSHSKHQGVSGDRRRPAPAIRRCAVLPGGVVRRSSAHIRSDNGAEFAAKAVREWLARVGVKTLYIAPGSPWENGDNESINGELGGELLDGEIFHSLNEARVPIERWRHHYNTVRPHSALGNRPPAPQAIAPRRTDPAFAMAGLQPDQPLPETVPGRT